MTSNTVAIIPARGGSKRCPEKNTATFKGKSLIAHTIEQALESAIFDQVIVSSDNPKIIDIASEYNVSIDEREDALASANATLIDVIRNTIYKYSLKMEDIVGLLLVTAPLRTIQDILEAYEIFCSSQRNNSVVSVTFNESPIQLSWRMENGHLTWYFNEQENIATRKQDFETTYRYNDALIFDLAKKFSEPDRNLFGRSPIPYIMPPERSIYIDYEFQLKLVQLLGMYDEQTRQNR